MEIPKTSHPVYVSSSRKFKPNTYRISFDVIGDKPLIAINVSIDVTYHVGHTRQYTAFIVKPEDFNKALNQVHADMKYSGCKPYTNA